jgi:crossover junction endodeoxyribonuclease RusA
MMRFILPFPPSVNHYWGTSGRRRFISAAGVAFRTHVCKMVLSTGFKVPISCGPVKIKVELRRPDHRRRDIDNHCGKALLDALTHAGVWVDDSQVVDIHAWWGPNEKPGFAIVEIEEAA